MGCKRDNLVNRNRDNNDIQRPVRLGYAAPSRPIRWPMGEDSLSLG